jgi:hypothetical protein
MNLRNFYPGKNCISFFLNSEVIFFRQWNENVTKNKSGKLFKNKKTCI